MPYDTDEVLCNLWIDKRLDSYRLFSSDGWNERLLHLVQDAPRLDEIAFVLIRDWRGALLTASLPSIMVDQLGASVSAFMNSGPTFGPLAYANMIFTKLSADASWIAREPELEARLRTSIVTVASECRRTFAQTKVEIPNQSLWEHQLQLSQFHEAIWGAMRICYVSIYNAYDNFIRQCLSVACDTEATTRRTKWLVANFSAAFGKEAFDTCWESDAIEVARTARNVLTHEGGHVTKQTALTDHFLVKDGMLHIWPDDIKALLRILRDAVWHICDIAKDRPAFKEES